MFEAQYHVQVSIISALCSFEFYGVYNGNNHIYTIQTDRDMNPTICAYRLLVIY